MHSEQLWPPTGDFLDAASQIVERRAGMTHQICAGRGEPDRSGASLKQRGTHRAFQLSDGVADGARGQVQFVRSVAEGASARSRFEGADR